MVQPNGYCGTGWLDPYPRFWREQLSKGLTMATKGVNKVILVGNMGNDPEVRYMPNGNAVANLSLATSESWKDQQGQVQERTEWHATLSGVPRRHPQQGKLHPGAHQDGDPLR